MDAIQDANEECVPTNTSRDTHSSSSSSSNGGNGPIAIAGSLIQHQAAINRETESSASSPNGRLGDDQDRFPRQSRHSGRVVDYTMISDESSPQASARDRTCSRTPPDGLRTQNDKRRLTDGGGLEGAAARDDARISFLRATDDIGTAAAATYSNGMFRHQHSSVNDTAAAVVPATSTPHDSNGSSRKRPRLTSPCTVAAVPHQRRFTERQLMPSTEAASSTHRNCLDRPTHNSTDRYTTMDPNEAIAYLHNVKQVLHSNDYNDFLDIMRAAKSGMLPKAQVIDSVSKLFRGKPDLVAGFNRFLPPGYHAISLPKLGLETTKLEHRTDYGEAELLLRGSGSDREPIHFQLAFNFMVMLKKRLANKPETLTTFLQTIIDYNILHRDNRGIYNKVHELLADEEPELLHEFSKFASIGDGGAAVSDLKGTACLESAERTQLPTQSDMNRADHIRHLFRRVRRFLGNDISNDEFLKVLNLFNQGAIDVETTINKVADFLKGNPELLEEFKALFSGTPVIGTIDSEQQENTVLRNRESHRQRLANRKNKDASKESGPSYRLISKRADQPRCSGRDVLCNQVLNDEYASHPIWASEDGGFIASKKNQAEEMLHKIEEERYALDRLIDSGTNLLGLLTQIENDVAKLPPRQRQKYRAPSHLGAGTEMAYKFAIRRLYPRDGDKISALLQANPTQVAPSVLKLLQTKLEDWKRKKTVLEKGWKESERDSFYKALDICCAPFKNSDKKSITNKALISEIECLHFERRDEMCIDSPHMTFQISDTSVLDDVNELFLDFTTCRMDYNSSAVKNIKRFASKFTRTFFTAGIPYSNDNESKTNGFVANDTLYCIARLYQIIYKRLEKMKTITDEYEQDPESTKEKYRAEINVDRKLVNHNGVNLRFSHGYYATLLELMRQLIRGGIDQGDFEACTRYIFGVEAYVLFTIDKVLHTLSQQINHAVSDESTRELVTLYAKNGEGLSSPSLDSVALYCLEAKELQPKDARLYVMFASRMPEEPNKCTVTITLLKPDDEIETKRLEAYEDYVRWFSDLDAEELRSPSSSAVDRHARPPFLRRNLRPALAGRTGYHSGAEYKICQNTYKLFYVVGTEDYMSTPRRRRGPQ